LEELFQLLNVSHTKTSLTHPQCNAQVEVFNKTVKKFLQSFVDDTTLNWETFLPALAISYNTSYHSTIATTPFELLFRRESQTTVISEWRYSTNSLRGYFCGRKIQLVTKLKG
jgi:hypothetical protein